MSPSFFFVAAREWTRRGLEEQKRGCPHGPTTGVKVDFFRKQENRLMHYLHFPPSPPSNPHTFFFFLYTYLHLFPRSVLPLKLSVFLSHTHKTAKCNFFMAHSVCESPPKSALTTDRGCWRLSESFFFLFQTSLRLTLT